MSEAEWDSVAVDDVKPGDMIRLSSGASFTVARIDAPFLGMDAMVCFIEDNEQRWHAYPAARGNPVEVRRT